jgi:hypothetical protein
MTSGAGLAMRLSAHHRILIEPLMNQSPTSAAWWLLGVVLLLLLTCGAGTALWYLRGPGKRPDAGQRDNDSQEQLTSGGDRLAPIRPSRLRNTGPEAAYVGSQACAACHAAEYDSYLRTAHSRALSEIDLAAEPPDDHWTHEKSGRHYRVFRRQDQLWHAESLATVAPAEPAPEPAPEPVGHAAPMRYVIGSGHHSRSYLFEKDGFLIESPVTWYASKNAWDMSPGYDRREHDGFERMADFGCLYCHAGRVTPKNDSRFRVTIQEATIGCESCHGPGSLHVQLRRSDAVVEGDDVTIVHPDKLPRERNEDVCAQCHLRGAASIALRGRYLHDFRPGLSLSDFRVDYAPQQTDEAMKVVGHVEQMRHSECYRSSTMTCTACHDPHGAPAPENRIAFYRDKCHACHSESCGLAEAERLQRNADNDCVACHMPRSETDIPHIAFTHHRIGFHQERAVDEPPLLASMRLEAIGGDAHLSIGDRDRGLGLAYMELIERARTGEELKEYSAQAQQLLEQALQRQVHDAAALAALARLAWQQGNLDNAMEFAGGSLSQPDMASGAHANALLIMGDGYLQRSDPKTATQALQRLVQTRRRAADWLLLGLAYADSGDLTQAAIALENVVQINPFRGDVHEELARLYQALNNPVASQKHAEAARRLAASAAEPPPTP